jgi:hypothetical protein
MHQWQHEFEEQARNDHRDLLAELSSIQNAQQLTEASVKETKGMVAEMMCMMQKVGLASKAHTYTKLIYLIDDGGGRNSSGWHANYRPSALRALHQFVSFDSQDRVSPSESSSEGWRSEANWNLSRQWNCSNGHLRGTLSQYRESRYQGGSRSEC